MAMSTRRRPRPYNSNTAMPKTMKKRKLDIVDRSVSSRIHNRTNYSSNNNNNNNIIKTQQTTTAIADSKCAKNTTNNNNNSTNSTTNNTNNNKKAKRSSHNNKSVKSQRKKSSKFYYLEDDDFRAEYKQTLPNKKNFQAQFDQLPKQQTKQWLYKQTCFKHVIGPVIMKNFGNNTKLNVEKTLDLCGCQSVGCGIVKSHIKEYGMSKIADFSMFDLSLQFGSKNSKMGDLTIECSYNGVSQSFCWKLFKLMAGGMKRWTQPKTQKDIVSTASFNDGRLYFSLVSFGVLVMSVGVNDCDLSICVDKMQCPSDIAIWWFQNWSVHGIVEDPNNHSTASMIAIHHNKFIGDINENLQRIQIKFYSKLSNQEIARNLTVFVNGKDLHDFPNKNNKMTAKHSKMGDLRLKLYREIRNGRAQNACVFAKELSLGNDTNFSENSICKMTQKEMIRGEIRDKYKKLYERRKFKCFERSLYMARDYDFENIVFSANATANADRTATQMIEKYKSEIAHRFCDQSEVVVHVNDGDQCYMKSIIQFLEINESQMLLDANNETNALYNPLIAPQTEVMRQTAVLELRDCSVYSKVFINKATVIGELLGAQCTQKEYQTLFNDSNVSHVVKTANNIWSYSLPVSQDLVIVLNCNPSVISRKKQVLLFVNSVDELDILNFANPAYHSAERKNGNISFVVGHLDGWPHIYVCTRRDIGKNQEVVIDFGKEKNVFWRGKLVKEYMAHFANRVEQKVKCADLKEFVEKHKMEHKMEKDNLTDLLPKLDMIDGDN